MQPQLSPPRHTHWDSAFNYCFVDEVLPMVPVAQLGLELPWGRGMREMWMWDPHVPSCTSWKEPAADLVLEMLLPFFSLISRVILPKSRVLQEGLLSKKGQRVRVEPLCSQVAPAMQPNHPEQEAPVPGTTQESHGNRAGTGAQGMV